MSTHPLEGLSEFERDLWDVTPEDVAQAKAETLARAQREARAALAAAGLARLPEWDDLMAWLDAATDHVHPYQATNERLRHVNAQRCLYRHLRALAEKGKELSRG